MICAEQLEKANAAKHAKHLECIPGERKVHALLRIMYS
jgi:hypothetical protein